MNRIPLVDLKAQYREIKDEIDAAILTVIENTEFIQGSEVRAFEDELAKSLDVHHAISCANGTDALQLSLMAMELPKGSEVITPAFSYIAVAEVCALLGLKLKLVDVNPQDFNICIEDLASKVSHHTTCIIPVHLFGQACDMAALVDICRKNSIMMIEDNAQSIGAEYMGKHIAGKTGSFGKAGTLSFFPSKNLGCYGDGGAVVTNDTALAKRLKMISQHGQSQKYHHDYLGLNSRLDTIQAAVLRVKLKRLNNYSAHRQRAAAQYDAQLNDIEGIITPQVLPGRTHVFHQYTIRVTDKRRDELARFLASKSVASSVYYPLPVYRQKAYRSQFPAELYLPNTEKLCGEVLSLPMHSHIDESSISYVSELIRQFMHN